ncbi:MAG TPA: hypothetical protein VD994_15325 [Prosthecobacter sp.]|nr:hypothetical protein [Prosthecobacter sp.]
MKTVSITLLISLQLSASAFGGRDEGDDWLPVPDGYVWPALAPDAKDFEPVSKPVADLPSAAQELFEEATKPATVAVFEVDLNADGKEEMFVEIPSLRGTGGTHYALLSPDQSGGYRSIGDLQGWGILFRLRKDGWYQIEGTSKSGGGNLTRYLLTFTRGEYRISRNEGHDYNRGVVTVREAGKE